MGQPKHAEHVVYPQCPICGKSMSFNSRRTNYYCSAACKQKAYRQKHGIGSTKEEHYRKVIETKRSQDIHVTCQECDRSFMVDQTKAATMYCSAACKQKAYRARVAEKAVFEAELRKTAKIASWLDLPEILRDMGKVFYGKHGFNWDLMEAGVRVEGNSCFLDTQRGDVIYFQNKDKARSFLVGYVVTGRPNFAALRKQ